jgi:YtkA-like
LCFRERSVFRFAFSVACALLLAGCSRTAAPSAEPQSVVAIAHEISPAPPRVGPATVTLKLTDGAGKVLPGAHVTIEAEMSHAGMSPQFTEAKEKTLGSYRAQIEFEMAGDWVILVHVTLPNGKKLERQIDVRGVRPN